MDTFGSRLRKGTQTKATYGLENALFQALGGNSINYCFEVSAAITVISGIWDHNIGNYCAASIMAG